MSSLKKSLGLLSLIFYSVGLIIGAGVYSVIGAAAGKAQENLWISFLLAALVAALTGLSYAELATTFPKAGAEYVYARRAFPRWQSLSFIIGFILTVAVSATACTVALAFAGYLSTFIEVPAFVVAFALLALGTAINLVGIRESSWINIVFTLIEIAGLVLVIWVGANQPAFFSSFFHPALNSGVFAGASLIFFVYLGFEEIANIAEEAKDPARDIPLAILISLVVTTILYVLVAISVITLASPEALAESKVPLLTAIEKVSPRFVGVLGGVALFSTANTVLLSLVAASRMLFGMGRDGAMPHVLAIISKQRKTPWVACLAVFVIAAAFLPFGNIEIIAKFSSAASLLAFASVSLCLIVLRYTEPGLKRPFKVPLSIGKFPVFPAIALLSVVALGFHFDAQTYLMSAVMLLVGLSVYLVWKRFRSIG